MSESAEAQRSANIARARAMMTQFTPQKPEWVDGLHPDIVMEFPFGADVGLPARVEGKAHCAGLFQAAQGGLSLSFHDLELHGMADPDLVLAEYGGKGDFKGKPYNQRYITLLRFKDGKLILYREYVDSKVVENVIGHLSALT